MRSGANQRPWIFLAPKRPQLSCEMTGLHQEYKMQFAGQASSSKQTKEKKFITPCDVLGTHNFKGRPARLIIIWARLKPVLPTLNVIWVHRDHW